MCGFAAIVEVGGGRADAAALVRMAAALEHRGPDDAGFFTDGAVAFEFRRLAILDPSSASHQPMESPDGAAVLVFNGAIFNYVELRAELRSLGHEFRSTGDTEVLLAAYRQWGRECLHRLNGMWAFLLYARARRALFGARDRFGIKPL
jgi:asparagine synthase (glutamine-hydrolysing)